MRPVFLLLLAMGFWIPAVADDDELDRVKQQLVDELMEARESDRKAEETLVARGLAMQDAERIVYRAMDGVVECLLGSVQRTSDGQLDKDALAAVGRSLELYSINTVLRDRILMTDEQADVCALDVLQQAGLTMDLLGPGEADSSTDDERRE